MNTTQMAELRRELCVFGEMNGQLPSTFCLCSIIYLDDLFCVEAPWMCCWKEESPAPCIIKNPLLFAIAVVWNLRLSICPRAHAHAHINTEAPAIQKQMQKPTDNQASLTLHVSTYTHTLTDGFQKVEQIKEWNNLCCLSTMMESDLRTSTYEEGNKGFGCH